MLCVDLGKYKKHEELVNAVDPLVNSVSMSTHLKLIIAHSSGEGFGAHCSAILERLEILDSTYITAEHFSTRSGGLVNIYGLSKIPMNMVVEQTNRNPLLMQYFRGAKSKHWKKNCCCIPITSGNCTKVEKFTASTFNDLSELSEIQAFSTNTSHYLYLARTGIEICAGNLQQFLKSWVHQDGHCYITFSNEKVFKIALNFPGFDRIID